MSPVIDSIIDWVKGRERNTYDDLSYEHADHILDTMPEDVEIDARYTATYMKLHRNLYEERGWPFYMKNEDGRFSDKPSEVQSFIKRYRQPSSMGVTYIRRGDDVAQLRLNRKRSLDHIDLEWEIPAADESWVSDIEEYAARKSAQPSADTSSDTGGTPSTTF